MATVIGESGTWRIIVADVALHGQPISKPRDPDHLRGACHNTAVREQFTEHDIPAYFAYARQFTPCDHYFTDVAGPSTPNHLVLITARSPLDFMVAMRDGRGP